MKGRRFYEPKQSYVALKLHWIVLTVCIKKKVIY